MENVKGDFKILYQREEPHTHGITLETYMDSVQVNDAAPLEAELETAVCCLHPIKAGKHTHLCMDHFKQWLQEAYSGENPKTPQGQSAGCAW